MNVLVLIAAMTIAAGESPVSLVREGGFDRSIGWTLGPARLVNEGNPGPGLHFDRQGGASQDIYVGATHSVLTVACDIRVTNVQSLSASPGYAFAAVYQTDENGRLIAHHDFAQLRGSHDWNRFFLHIPG